MALVESPPIRGTNSAPVFTPESTQKIGKTLPEGFENADHFSVSRFKEKHNWQGPFTAVDKAFGKLTGSTCKAISGEVATFESLSYRFLIQIHQGLQQIEKFSAESLNQLLDEIAKLEPRNVQPLLKEAKALVDERVQKKPEKYKNFDPVNEFLTSKMVPEAEFSSFIETSIETPVDQKPVVPVFASHSRFSCYFPKLSTCLKVAGAAAGVGLGVGCYFYGTPALISNLSGYLPFRSAGNETTIRTDESSILANSVNNPSLIIPESSSSESTIVEDQNLAAGSSNENGIEPVLTAASAV